MDHGLVLSLLVMISAMQVAVVVPVVVGLRPPAIYVFGDSTLDVGNNNYLEGKDVPRADQPHYGVDFPGVPTGRFSNGYNTADYVAKSMGFVSSPPPYLSVAPSSSLLVLTALTTGVSYASAGAGILDSTNAGNNIPLSRQVQHFKATKGKMMSTMGSRAVNAMLSKSVFLIGVGSNDMFVFSTAQVSLNKSSAAEQQSHVVAAFYTSLISNYSATITELYSLGARRFAIINVGMVGCVPQPAGARAGRGGGMRRRPEPARRRLRRRAQVAHGQARRRPEAAAGARLLPRRFLRPHAGHLQEPAGVGVHGGRRRVLRRRRPARRRRGLPAGVRGLRRPRPLPLLGPGAPFPAGRHAHRQGLL